MQPCGIQALYQRLIVSVQADEGEPLNSPEILTAMAETCLLGGAAGVRMAQIENIRYFKQRHPDVPLIGLTKPQKMPENAWQQVYITPSTVDALALAQAGADMIAMDATQRPRPDGQTLAQMLQTLRQGLNNQTRQQQPTLMADLATLEEGLAAAQLGFDVLSTTLSGYTAETRVEARETRITHPDKPDFEPDFALLSALVSQTACPVILEGRVWTPEHVAEAFKRGAFAVVIGSAITRPQLITRRFAEALPNMGLTVSKPQRHSG